MKILHKTVVQKLLPILGSLLLIAPCAWAQDFTIYRDDNGVALAGYDAVAYHTKQVATVGRAEITAVHQNTIYRFSTEKNRDLFNTNPTQYLPQFGGFCSTGVGYGGKYHVDGKSFSVIDGKLYVNKNAQVHEHWLKNLSKVKKDAEKNWIDIRAENPEDL